MSGECVCVEGVAGRRCDSCGRGYVGTFPDCEACHQCFHKWDVNVGELTNHTQRLVNIVEDMKETGVATPYKDIISSLEDETRQLREILEDDKVQQTLTNTQRMLQQANETASVLRKSMDRSETDLKKVSADHQKAVENLDNLTKEAQNLQEISSDKQRRVLNIKNSDARGAADSIREYYRESGGAELRVDRAVSDSRSTVNESAWLRKAAEAKLDATEREFNLKHQLHIQRLDKIGSELNSSDLPRLSRQVCGGVSGLDGCGDCGGLGCVSEDGVTQCGGEGCETIVTQSQEALKKAKNLDQEVLHTLREVDKLNKMVSDARGRADEAKLSAQGVLLRANQSKARVEQNNDELRDLLQQIRDFLTNETDPKRIEEVADEVMRLSLPVSPGALKNMTTEINQHVSRLTSVDDILTQTADKALTAERLLQQAQAANESATALKQATDGVKEALEDTERAQTAASGKLKEVESDMTQTKEQITAVQSKTEATEFKLSISTGRSLDLERELDELQKKTVETSSGADQTQRQTDDITAEIEHTEREFDSLQPKYQLVSGLLDPNAAGVIDARQKAEHLRQEAKDLLIDATSKLQRLRELERSFVINQHTLVEKAQELDGLENEARDVLQELSHKITIYSTCA